MPRKLRHIVVLAMAFSILTGSVGMAATVRLCTMMGVSLTTPAKAEKAKKGCCAKAEKPACPKEAKSGKKKCCSVSVAHQKLDLESPTKFAKVEFLSLPAALANPFPLPLVAQVSLANNSWPFYADTSPPLAGRDLLHRIQVLTI